MMPYEKGYSYTSAESGLIDLLFKTICIHEPQFDEWSGFVMFIFKKIDNSKSAQIAVHDIAIDMKTILEDYLDNEIG